MAKLQLCNLLKRYGGITAVDGITLQVEHGHVISLLGPSGCGKTTTLHMLAGFLQPDGGEILVDDAPIHNLPPEKRNTGMVFQNYALFPHMTVAENIAFGLEMRGLGKSEIALRVAHGLDLVRLTGFAERYPRQLSGGQQQRVALARALVIEPSLLLLDEPLSNLDATLREEMRFEIGEIQRRVGITTVFVTHDQTEAMAISDVVAVMNKGQLAQLGTAEQIYSAPLDRFIATFIGQASLIPATVISGDGTHLKVRTPAGEELVVAGGAHMAVPGSRIEIVVRPEDLVLSTEPVAGRNNLRAVVTATTYLGSSTRVAAKAGEVPVIVSTNRPHLGLVPEAVIHLTWDPRHCSAVPEA